MDERRRYRGLESLSQGVIRVTGGSWAFTVAGGLILLWLASGPLFDWSQDWQMVVNTGTTIVTFLMVFLIQRAQNKDSRALHLKLDELVAAVQGASNRLLNVEDLSEEELSTLHRHYAALARLAKRDHDLLKSHSIEEAESRHASKPGSSP
jgi:low affinity Fe/Cu permease